MIFHLFRKLWIYLVSLTKPRLTSMEEVLKHEHRVLPTDLDENLHMNNAKFLTYTELARADFLFRSGMFQYAMKNKIMAVVANASIVYRRSLGPFQKFQLDTRIVSWDDDKAFFEHSFWSGGKLCARALVEARIVSRGARIPLSAVVRDLGLSWTDSFNRPHPMVETSLPMVKGLLRGGGSV